MRKPSQRRVSAYVERHLVNPIVKRLVSAGRLGNTYAVIETTGRRSGSPRRVPVANGLQGEVFWLISAHGPQAQYVKNLMAEPRVRLGLVRAGRLEWRSGLAHVLPDDDALARHRRLGQDRLGYRLDGLLLRATATNPTTIRIDLDPEPG